VKKILLPKSDVIFKLIFGSLKNIDLLSDFLRAALRLPDDEFTELTIIDPHLLREYPDGKMGILDVKAKTKSGKILHIDIQLLSKKSDNNCYPSSFIIRVDFEKPVIAVA